MTTHGQPAVPALCAFMPRTDGPNPRGNGDGPEFAPRIRTNWNRRLGWSKELVALGYCSAVGAVRRLLPNVQLTPDDVP